MSGWKGEPIPQNRSALWQLLSQNLWNLWNLWIGGIWGNLKSLRNVLSYCVHTRPANRITDQLFRFLLAELCWTYFLSQVHGRHPCRRACLAVPSVQPQVAWHRGDLHRRFWTLILLTFFDSVKPCCLLIVDLVSVWIFNDIQIEINTHRHTHIYIQYVYIERET